MKQGSKTYRIILSGGGTGGHIFPAIAIANALKKRLPEAEFLFVGAKGRMEMEKVPAAGYPIEALWISGLQRRLSRANLLFPFKVISSLFKAWRIIRRFKPDVVIGTGGYASGPTLRIASWMGIPSIIQEQNSFPGITNRMLAGRVDKICVAYNGLERFFPKQKILLTGNPVRSETIAIAGKQERAFEFFDLAGEGKVVLVIGGSLGAATINKSIMAALPEFAANGYRLIWQTGRHFAETARTALEPYPDKRFRVYDFIQRMDLAYSAADLIVSRAGAIAISELCCIGKPVILIPSPNVAEDHQTKNALALANVQAAMMVRDAEAQEKLPATIRELFENEVLARRLTENILTLASPNAADTIAGVVIGMLPGKEGKD